MAIKLKAEVEIQIKLIYIYQNQIVSEWFTNIQHTSTNRLLIQIRKTENRKDKCENSQEERQRRDRFFQDGRAVGVA